MARTYNDLYLDLRHWLRDHGVFEPNRAARELMRKATGKTWEELIRDGRLYAADSVERTLSDLAKRCEAGEPVAYLIGEWDFYGLPLTITPAVLIPRPDTEVLAERAIEAARSFAECRVLDLCAGSGCVGLAVARQVPTAHVTLGELDAEALSLCRKNIRRNGLSSRVGAVQTDALAPPQRQLGAFDVIVCNPPYIPSGDIPGLDPSVRDYEPHLALDGGADGLDFYRAICENWRAALHSCGKLIFEVGIRQAEDVARLLRGSGFEDIQTTDDPAGIPRVVCGTFWENENEKTG